MYCLYPAIRKINMSQTELGTLSILVLATFQWFHALASQSFTAENEFWSAQTMFIPCLHTLMQPWLHFLLPCVTWFLRIHWHLHNFCQGTTQFTQLLTPTTNKMQCVFYTLIKADHPMFFVSVTFHDYMVS